MTARGVNLGSGRSASSAYTHSRIDEIAKRQRQIPSKSLAGPPALRAVVAAPAHGRVAGEWITVADDAVALARPRRELPSGLADVGQVGSGCGVISAVLGDDQLEITTYGLVEGLDNTDDDAVDGEFVPGWYYCLSEQTPGAITGKFTSTNCRCFYATGPHSGYVIFSELPRAIFDGEGSATEVAGTVVDAAGDPADPAAVTDPGTLRLIAGDAAQGTAGSTASVAYGICLVKSASGSYGAEGPVWLAGDGSGQLVTVMPTTPATVRPVRIGYHFGDGLYLFDPRFELGFADLWDATPGTPARGDTWKWNPDTDRYELGQAGSTDGGDIDVATITLDKLIEIGPLAILGNNSDVDPAAVVEIPATPDTGVGQVFVRRTDDTLGFSEEIHLSSTGDGIGLVKVWFSPTKYVLIDTAGIDFYSGSTARVQIDTSAKVSITWPNSNTVVLDSSDVSGSSRALKIREMDVCDSSGVAKKVQGLFSALY